MSILRPLLLVLFGLACALASAWAGADQGPEHRGGKSHAPRVEQGRRPSHPPGPASRAGERARQETGGRVLGVTPDKGGFRVRVLTPKGEVRHLQLPER